MWSLSQTLQSLAQLHSEEARPLFPNGHLPDSFDASKGIRQLFPTSQPISISALKNYLFSLDTQIGAPSESTDANLSVRADGAGNWLLAVSFVFQGSPANINPRFGAGFVFAFSADGAGHGFVATGDGSQQEVTYCQATGFDPWIASNWIQLFQGGAYPYTSDATWFAKLPPTKDAATNNGFTGLASLNGPKPGDQTPPVEIVYSPVYPSALVNALWGPAEV
jgi:hypothetical protein